VRIAVVGTGAVGVRAARQALTAPDVDQVVIVSGSRSRAAELAASLGAGAVAGEIDDMAGVDVAILAGAGSHAELAQRIVGAGVTVVSTSGRLGDVEALLALDPLARERGAGVVPGAALAPGLVCLLVAHAAATLDIVDEVHVARAGTGGAACLAERAAILRSPGWLYERGWRRAPAGRGGGIVWFPPPVGGRDCRYAALPEAILIHRLAPEADRITARIAAGLFERWTNRIPSPKRRRQEGGLGAVHAEVRGRRDGSTVTEVRGAVDRPGAAVGAVAALVARAATGVVGARGVGEVVDATAALADLAAHGVKAARFVGTAA
jgi:hypothetical protein